LPKLSAGLLLYRHAGEELELLIAHPGGPIWQRRDEGAWGLPKGAVDDGESLLDAARREFEEELGHPPPNGPAIDLGEIRLRSGKIVHGWAVEGDFDPDQLYSMQAELVWPPRSGNVMRVPEIDRVIWARPEEARQRLHPAQAAFVDRLIEQLGAHDGHEPHAQETKDT
jgi:predicted NUDIX family NTP pyrophosphohydrolase